MLLFAFDNALLKFRQNAPYCVPLSQFPPLINHCPKNFISAWYFAPI